MVGETLLVALPLLPQFEKDARLGAHSIKRVLKGAELAGAIAAHPLRGAGYDFDVPLLPGDFVTTEAGTGFVHIAPSHGEDDFNLGRQFGLPVPETVADDGTFTRGRRASRACMSSRRMTRSMPPAGGRGRWWRRRADAQLSA